METFNIMGYTFKIIEQGMTRHGSEYAILIKDLDGETFWLKEPQIRYETLGGAYEAILLYMQNVTLTEY